MTQADPVVSWLERIPAALSEMLKTWEDAEIARAVLTFLEGIPPRSGGTLRTWEGHKLTQSPEVLDALVRVGKLVFVDGGYRLPDDHPHLSAPVPLSPELL